MKKYLFAAAAALFVVSCGTQNKGVATSNDSKTLTKGQMATAKKLYEAKCNTCHELPEPTAYTAEQWVPIMKSMAAKAKMTEQEHDWVYQYVTSVKK
ncbi:hypothetical protein [Elizabethkingia sp. JS20170427COW]|uniref:hypothetical protein n=1 Tax=Elizabethkingia sp. JS20170427COW TaxID=2583851 RepID=UPI0011101326|nr:hypothetical protein [Elizabethkingia sp. JS20170427COW]QCX53209.1 hypothetical protein FGE20_05445 [Elizabethkingia sp. JS20170427COW]